MPQKRSACKEIRKSKKKHLRNIAVTSEMKSSIRKYNALLEAKKMDQAKELLKVVSSQLSRASGKGIIHKNTASRKISRLSKKLGRAAKS